MNLTVFRITKACKQDRHDHGYSLSAELHTNPNLKQIVHFLQLIVTYLSEQGTKHVGLHPET